MNSMNNSTTDTLSAFTSALEAAREVLSRLPLAKSPPNTKSDMIPSPKPTEKSTACSTKNCCSEGEGWLSEETVDDFSRLDKRLVWVVDPLDGTREFVAGHSGILRVSRVGGKRRTSRRRHLQSRHERIFLGSLETGVTYNGKPAQPSQRRR